MRNAGYALFLRPQAGKATSSAAVVKSTKLPGSGTTAIATPGETASESWPAQNGTPLAAGIEDERAAGADGQARPVGQGVGVCHVQRAGVDRRAAAVAVRPAEHEIAAARLGQGAAAGDLAAESRCSAVAPHDQPDGAVGRVGQLQEIAARKAAKVVTCRLPG